MPKKPKNSGTSVKKMKMMKMVEESAKMKHKKKGK